MKVSFININTNILIGKEKDKIFEFLSRKLFECGVLFSKSMVTQSTPENIKTALSYVTDNFVIIVGDKSSIKNQQIKTVLAKCFGVGLQQNKKAIDSVNAFFKNYNIAPSLDAEGEYYVPVGAEVLTSEVSSEQGFLFYSQPFNKTFIFLPNNLDAVEYIFNNHLLPIIIKEVKIIYQTTVIKTFGISEKDILYLLQDLVNNNYKVLIATYPDNLEVAITIRYNKNIDKTIIQQFVTKIYEKLKKYIFTNENTNIYQMAYDLLKLSNKKLAIAETITNGNIINNFLSTSNGINGLFSCGMICNNVDSVCKNLNVNKSVINQYKYVSVETAYEMSANLLEKTGADIVLCTCGEWHSESIDASQLICYIAVGDADGIHVYKNTYSGDYKSVIDNISKSATFYLIKKIKQNDLFFGQITV